MMLKLENVSVKISDFLLHPLSFHLNPGEYAILLGPTGSGKTVFMETIVGLHSLLQGKIWLKGREISKLPPEKRGMGIVYQDYVLFPHLSVFANIGFGLRYAGYSRQDISLKVQKMANFFGIKHLLERKPVNLSGGEKQRVALARALVLNPYVLLLDEPLSALDKSHRILFQQELKRMHQELGVTVLHITHDLEEAFFLGEKIALIKHGKILDIDRPEQLLANPKTGEIARILGFENVFPARVHNQVVQTWLGEFHLDDPNLTAGDKINLPSVINHVLIPENSIYLNVQSKAYVWTGELYVQSIAQNNLSLKLYLVHSSENVLTTVLSLREASNLSLQPGDKLTVGIKKVIFLS